MLCTIVPVHYRARALHGYKALQKGLSLLRLYEVQYRSRYSLLVGWLVASDCRGLGMACAFVITRSVPCTVRVIEVV